MDFARSMAEPPGPGARTTKKQMGKTMTTGTLSFRPRPNTVGDSACTGRAPSWGRAMRTIIETILAILAAGIVVVMLSAGSAAAASRIKDVVAFEGVRDNMLVGYGLVVGLNGTGDNVSSSDFTLQSLKSMLNRLGVKPDEASLSPKNVAAVMVTASMPSFSRQGSRIDVTVSALGDASSLLGGTLLVTPLLGADGEVYAVSQGQLAVGGFTAGGDAETITKGVPTSARIANGAIIEREVAFSMNSMEKVNLTLRNPDFTTARRIAQAVNAFLGQSAATATDPTTVALQVPGSYAQNVVDLLTDIEQLRIDPDQLARIIIDEQSGTIVMGENVRISTVAIAQGSLTIRITESEQVSQPGPFAEVGTTEVVDRTMIAVDEDQSSRLAVVAQGVSLQELVNGLNSLGIGPRDMITILQAVKAAGALQAEIQVM